MKLSLSVVGAGVLGLATGIGAVMLVPVVHGKNPPVGILSAHDSPVTVRGGSIRAWTVDQQGWTPIDSSGNAFSTHIPDPSYKNNLLVVDHRLNVSEIPEITGWEVDLNDRADDGTISDATTSGIKLCSDLKKDGNGNPERDANGNYTCLTGQAPSGDSVVYMLVMDNKNDSLKVAAIQDGETNRHKAFHRKKKCKKCEYVSYITIKPNTGSASPYKCHNSDCVVGLSN